MGKDSKSTKGTGKTGKETTKTSSRRRQSEPSSFAATEPIVPED